MFTVIQLFKGAVDVLNFHKALILYTAYTMDVFSVY